MFITSAEGTEEIIEEVLQYNTDDIYNMLQTLSGQLSELNNNLDSLELIGTQILQFLQESYLDSIAALLLILVGFECMRLVRGWMKGRKHYGHNS